MTIDVYEIANSYYLMYTDEKKVPPAKMFIEFFDKENYKNLFLSVKNGKYDEKIQKIILKVALGEFLKEKGVFEKE